MHPSAVELKGRARKTCGNCKLVTTRPATLRAGLFFEYDQSWPPSNGLVRYIRIFFSNDSDSFPTRQSHKNATKTGANLFDG